MAKYAKAQCVAFHVRPGTKEVHGTEIYLGKDKATDDIDNRCAFMISAIQKAYDMVKSNTPKPQKVSRSVNNSVDSDPVLKIFMAPEFYFRGSEGGYPVELISEIIPKLRKETDQEKYKHWLFVFGTAIGYNKLPDEVFVPIKAAAKDGSGFDVITVHLPHADWENATCDEYATAVITDLESGGGDDILMTLSRDAGFKTNDQVHFSLDPNTPTKFTLKAAGPHPKATKRPSITVEEKRQHTCPTCGHPYFVSSHFTCLSCKHTHRSMNIGSHVHAASKARTATVTKIERQTEDNYKITLNVKDGYEVGNYVLIKRESTKKGVTEIQNAALVRKGGPDSSGAGLREVIVYKEFVSHIDYIGPLYGKGDAFNHPTTGREIMIHGESRLVIATWGSQHTAGHLGADPNVPGTTLTYTDSKGTQQTQEISEINKSGYGGGSVFTIDEIAFGLEVCLDHAKERLRKFYANAAKSGDPKIQIQLIPSWGMSITGSSVCCVKDGIVYNVDGARSDSKVVTSEAKYACSNHPLTKSDTPDKCSLCGLYYCEDHYKTTKKVFANATDKCSLCAKPLTYYEPTFELITTKSDALAGPTRVYMMSLTRSWSDYFENKGNIVVYPVLAIPAAETVP